MRWLVDKETDKESDKKRQKTSSGPSSVSSAPDNNEALQVIESIILSLITLLLLSASLHNFVFDCSLD